MRRFYRVLIVLALTLWTAPAAANGQATDPSSDAVRVDVVKQPYKGSRNVPELATNPDYIHASGLERKIREWGATLVRPVQGVQLTPEEEKQYGEWERLALANGHVADLIEGNPDRGILTVALEANCSSLMGMVGGLQRAPDGGTRRVGVLWLDAHGDFNTPQTTLSGMLGGMPVAISAGHTLRRLRTTSGQREPIPVEHIVWGGVRDLDPLEKDRFEKHGVRQIPASELRSPSGQIEEQLNTSPSRRTSSTSTSTWTCWRRKTSPVTTSTYPAVRRPRNWGLCSSRCSRNKRRQSRSGSPPLPPGRSTRGG